MNLQFQYIDRERWRLDKNINVRFVCMSDEIGTWVEAKEIKEIRGPDISWIINMKFEVTMSDVSGRGGQ